MPLSDNLIVALDVETPERALDIVTLLDDAVDFYKIGHELIYHPGGAGLLEDLRARNKRIFLDAKLYDIERTVAAAISQLAWADFITVHGHPKLIKAACRARNEMGSKKNPSQKNPGPKILAVTVLTCFDEADVILSPEDKTISDMVCRMAGEAFAQGADGVIASALEARRLRALAGDQKIIVTPGIRLPGQKKQDQKRTASPSEALEAGADYLVIGRTITETEDPLEAVKSVLADINKARA